jgi:Undecaprenyl-phosphate galactose phosphotransferase WbaP
MNRLAVVEKNEVDDLTGETAVPSGGVLRQSPWAGIVLIIVDTIAVEVSLALGFTARNALAFWWPIDIGVDHVAGMAIGLLVLPLGYYVVGLHPGYGVGPVERLRKRVLTTTLVFGTLILWDHLVFRGSWSRGVLVLTFFFTLLLPPLFEAASRRALIRWHLWGRLVAILGANETGVAIFRMLRENPMLGLVPIGFLDDRVKRDKGRVQPVHILGRPGEASLVCPNVHSAIIAIPNAQPSRLNDLLLRLPFSDVTIIPNLLGLQTLWISAQDLNGILGLSVKRNLLLSHNRIIKRITDLVLGSAAFAIALPIIGFFAVIIKIIDPGPAFCQQERIGEYGHPFKMLKLRSMCVDAEERLAEHLAGNPEARKEWDQFMKLRNDPRILPIVGHFIRRLSIDELPQLWHVLTGEMSLVGPRPFPRYHVDRFSADFQELRASVRPGLTGLWQVSSRSNGNLKVQEAQDTYFIRNWSLWLDLHVLMRTFAAVSGANGAR